MALFNKKSTADASPEPNSAPVPDAFDFDEIARGLDAENGPSPLDSLLSQPVSSANSVDDANAAPPDSHDLAFDDIAASESPDEPFDFGLPSTPVTAGTLPMATPVTGVSVPASPPAPVAPTTLPASDPYSFNPTPIVGSNSPDGHLRTKKSLPLVPILGVLGVLAVVGGGAMFVLNSQGGESPATLPSSPPPSNSVAPIVPPAQVSNGAPSSGGQSGSTTPLVKNSGAIPTVPLTPMLKSQLKTLWKNGAAAKKRRDYVGARAAWEQMLKLRPHHPGIQEAIDKLPPASVR